MVLDAQEIGESALTAFNSLGDDNRTRSVPALLLLDEHQQGWKDQANTADHRLVLSMPITLKKLRETLARLIPSGDNDPASDG